MAQTLVWFIFKILIFKKKKQKEKKQLQQQNPQELFIQHDQVSKTGSQPHIKKKSQNLNVAMIKGIDVCNNKNQFNMK